ncbi:MAG: histidine phosphatase family protein [Acinetobacter sp.]|uniref:histidine phosphatase family protein n=1 Tax=Acinetobacter sp. TaxID=472 RepID=UPI002589A5A5|nr:histidine phosphatase family protein [Acinetobacter sp.]MCE1271262.1 histidine phosphatase family protein [Acinetobacter sp.]
MQIDLLRHGETTLSHTLRGHLDDDLTEQGWLQMQSTIQQYMTTPVDWDVIISSPLRRCRRFAEHLADQLGLPMRVNEHIKEMYFGDWEGISTQAIYEAEPERLANFWQFPTQYHAPNGESLTQFQQRIFIGFEQIYTQIQAQNGQKALVITHGGVIKLLTCLAQQQNPDDLLKMLAELGKLYSFSLSKYHEKMQFEIL